MEGLDKRKMVMRRIGTLQTLVRVGGKRCWYCGKKFISFSEVEIDHIVPRCRGGRDTISNYAIACLFCNGAKGSQTLEDFLSWLRRPKCPLPFLHDRAKSSEQHWRDYGDAITKGLRKASSWRQKKAPRLYAHAVKVVEVTE